jgi:membrane protein
MLKYASEYFTGKQGTNLLKTGIKVISDHKAFRFFLATGREFIRDNLFLRAMALTFATFLSLVPLLVISFSMFKMFGGAEWFMEVLRPVILRNLTPGSGPIVADKINNLLLTGGDTMVGGIGLIFLLFAVYGVAATVEGTFNLIWDVRSRGGSWRRLPLYWGMLTIIPILVGSSLALTTYLKALPIVATTFTKIDFAESMMNRSLPTLMVMLGFFLLYRFLPGTKVRTVAALVGTGIAILLYEMVKAGFIFYTGKLVEYDVIYGSLAAIPMLMIWVNLSWIVVLIGVEVSFVFQNFKLIENKHKNIRLSRTQQDALAYLILAQVTHAFQGKRPTVTRSEWSIDWRIPPEVVSSIVKKLIQGEILKQAGNRGEELILALAPEALSISEIDKILTFESQKKWTWPPEAEWETVKAWLAGKNRKGTSGTDGMLLSDFVAEVANVPSRSENKR